MGAEQRERYCLGVAADLAAQVFLVLADIQTEYVPVCATKVKFAAALVTQSSVVEIDGHGLIQRVV